MSSLTSHLGRGHGLGHESGAAHRADLGQLGAKKKGKTWGTHRENIEKTSGSQGCDTWERMGKVVKVRIDRI